MSTNLPRINVPPSVAPTPEEIERRREHFRRVMAHREKIGPIGISTDELVRLAREELEGEVVRSYRGDRAMTVTNDRLEATLRRIKIPPIPPPTPEELERRREAVDRVLATRDKIGPIGISTSQLIREVRDEADGIDE